MLKGPATRLSGLFVMPQFDLVIFDCDGVLVDSEPVSNGVMQRSLARYGLPLPLDEVMRIFVGGTLEGGFRRAKEHGADLPQDWVSQINAEICVALAAQAGQAVGMAVFGFAADTPADRLRPVCNQVFDDMAELPRLLGV